MRVQRAMQSIQATRLETIELRKKVADTIALARSYSDSAKTERIQATANLANLRLESSASEAAAPTPSGTPST
ncbi:MAG TPA: hypothetical protein VLI90_13950, partial [Tepidisphaeraceae bacterium]|nr:hypothetical protein [Tepidisphaeraceae bacterium]